MSRVKKPKKLGKDKTVHEWLIPELRKISYRWPKKDIAKGKARVRVESGEFYKNGNPIMVSKYKCADCEGLFLPGEFDLDHINPVVELDGFTNWDDYILRLFVNPEGYQVLCKECHKIKSHLENEERRERRKKAKNNKKDEDLY